jgi:hypothetical protein
MKTVTAIRISTGTGIPRAMSVRGRVCEFITHTNARIRSDQNAVSAASAQTGLLGTPCRRRRLRARTTRATTIAMPTTPSQRLAVAPIEPRSPPPRSW